METFTVSEAAVSEAAATTTTEIVDSSGNPVSIVQVSLPNQPVQVQSLIHGQPSVIQTTGGTIQTIQVTPVSEGETDDDADSKKRREILARRPSYRRILNELSSDAPGAITVHPKIEEESNSSQTSQESQEANEAATNLTTQAVTYIQNPQAGIVKVVPTQTIQIAAQDGSHQGLQTLTMTNVSGSTAPATGATIVQYAQGPDGQFFIPAGNVQAYQITTPTSLPQGVVMATAATTIGSPPQIGEDASRKREFRLLKNRELRLLKNKEAARECRRKKKEYVKCLENRVAVLENQNKALIEELKSLKELYCQKEG